MLLVLVGIAMLRSGLLALLSRSILQPLARLSSLMRQINGNFTQRIVHIGDNEIGKVAAVAVDAMQQQAAIIGRIQAASSALNEVSALLHSNVDAAERFTSEANHRAVAVNVAGQKITQSVREVSQSVEGSVQATIEAAISAKTAQDALS